MTEIHAAYFRVRERLKKLNEEETAFNLAVSNYNKQIKVIQQHKKRLLKRISNNRKYRNELINRL